MFVDDCIMAVQAERINEVLNEFNKYNKKLQFTIELETYQQINFLDLTLHHIGNSIKMEWYTKKYMVLTLSQL